MNLNEYLFSDRGYKALALIQYRQRRENINMIVNMNLKQYDLDYDREYDREYDLEYDYDMT